MTDKIKIASTEVVCTGYSTKGNPLYGIQAVGSDGGLYAHNIFSLNEHNLVEMAENYVGANVNFDKWVLVATADELNKG